MQANRQITFDELEGVLDPEDKELVMEPSQEKTGRNAMRVYDTINERRELRALLSDELY